MRCSGQEVICRRHQQEVCNGFEMPDPFSSQVFSNAMPWPGEQFLGGVEYSCVKMQDVVLYFTPNAGKVDLFCIRSLPAVAAKITAEIVIAIFTLCCHVVCFAKLLLRDFYLGLALENGMFRLSDGVNAAGQKFLGLCSALNKCVTIGLGKVPNFFVVSYPFNYLRLMG
jgi:hypothetical protein